MARILTLTNWYPPHHRGGYEINCADVMQRMVERGHRVEVLCSDDRLPDAGGDAPGVRVRRELRLYWRDGAPWCPGMSEAMRIERANQGALEKALSDLQPDVLSVWHMGALSLNLLTTAARRGIPMVYAICDSWPNYAVDMDAWSKRWQGSPVARAVGRVAERASGLPAVLPDLGRVGRACFVSSFTKADVCANSPWAFSTADVIPSGIDRSGLAQGPEAPPRPWGWRLLYMGRFDRRKGTDTLLRALTLLPEATLGLYGRGGGSEQEHVERLASQLGLGDRVRTGSLERHEVGAAYRAADCLVFPSEWPEPFGLVPLEAMECGVPVVATGVGGSGEFLTDGVNCVLFEAADPAALAAAVRRLAGDGDLRARIRTAGRVTARGFDVGRMADAYERRFVAASRGQVGGVGTQAAWQVERPAVTAPGDPIGRHQVAADWVLWQTDGTSRDDEVKRLYRDLGDDWWNTHQEGTLPIPVLSAPETAPKVIECMAEVRGLILDAGCGPIPAVSIGLASSDARVLVSMDIGLGTVRVARATGLANQQELLAVVGDVERLPFRAGAFNGVVCDDTIEHLPDDKGAAIELARVLKPSGWAVLATPNRHSMAVLKARLADRWRGRHRPTSYYFVSNSHLREYTWAEFERLVTPAFSIRRRVPVGWQTGRKRRLISPFLIGPARRLSQTIILEAQPR